MRIAIELNAAQMERLRAMASELGVDAGQLTQVAVVDLISAGAEDFVSPASRVLDKNRELYRRLAT